MLRIGTSEWLVFGCNLESAPARKTLYFAVAQTMASHSGSIIASLDSVSETKRLPHWIRPSSHAAIRCPEVAEVQIQDLEFARHQYPV